jgi:hypothetical protein
MERTGKVELSPSQDDISSEFELRWSVDVVQAIYEYTVKAVTDGGKGIDLQQWVARLHL